MPSNNGRSIIERDASGALLFTKTNVANASNSIDYGCRLSYAYGGKPEWRIRLDDVGAEFEAVNSHSARYGGMAAMSGV